jgi:mRNA interferase RelE/StbE
LIWAVFYRPGALRDLRKLPPEPQRALHLAAEGLASDPRPVGCRKIAGSENRWRLRVGDYRLVYEVDDRAAQVLIVAVGHRREVYR